MFHRKAAECKMMRKLCLFLITILVVAACTTDESVMDVCQQKFQRRDFKEGYIPKGSPICVTLPNGLTLNMDEDSTYYLGYVAVTKEYLFRSSEDDRGTTAVEHLYFTIPAGVKEYYIGQGSYVEQRDYGNLTRLEETNYVLESI